MKFTIEGLRQADHEAFLYLYSTFYDKLCYVLGSWKSILSTQEIEDVVTESMITVYNRREKFEDYKHVERFLFKVTKYLGLNAITDKRKRSERMSSLTYVFEEAYDQGTEAKMTRRYIVSDPKGAYYSISLLPSRLRDIMYLSFMAGLGSEEVSRELGINKRKVFNARAEGLRVIKTIYQFTASPLKYGILKTMVLAGRPSYEILKELGMKRSTENTAVIYALREHVMRKYHESKI